MNVRGSGELERRDPAYGLDLQTERFRITLSWCIRLRWAAVAGQLVTISFVTELLDVAVPRVPLGSILAAEVVLNLALNFWYHRPRPASQWSKLARRGDLFFFTILVVDFVFLGALLYFTGGPANPFSVFYFVNLTLAAVVLSPRWAWTLIIFAVISYMALFFDHRPLRELEENRDLAVQGALAAFTSAAGIMVYLLTRMRGELANREDELARARQREAKREKLEALATLAAGAAHELASPLSTIAVVARELEVELDRSGSQRKLIDDARLVRQEVTRCRSILDRMAVGRTERGGEETVRIRCGDLPERVLADFQESRQVLVDVDDAARGVELALPLSSFAQALRALLRNAIDASPPGAEVVLAVALSGDEVHVAVSDKGCGMPPEVLSRAGEPFFTTKEPGQGMGLGIFLARAVVEHLSGEIRIDSRVGRGTTVTIAIPLV